MRLLTKSGVENISEGYNGNGPSSGMTGDGDYGGQANGRVGNSSGGMSGSCAAGLGAGIIGDVVAGSSGGPGVMIVGAVGELIAGSGNQSGFFRRAGQLQCRHSNNIYRLDAIEPQGPWVPANKCLQSNTCKDSDFSVAE